MARYGVVVLLIVVMATTAVFAGACGTQRGGTQQVGEMQRQSQSIQAQNAQSVRANLKMGAGELNLTGGADRLMEAEFSYNVANWKPKVNYNVSGDTGGGCRRIQLGETLVNNAYPAAEDLHLRIALWACRFKARPGEGDASVAATYHDPTDRRSARIIEEGQSVTITEAEPSFERIPVVFGGVPCYELEFGKQSPLALTIEIGRA